MRFRGWGVVATVVVLCCLVGIGVLAAPAAAEGPAGMNGSGTTDDPYEITNATQLQAMEQNLGAHYVLVNDVDASTVGEFTPVGSFGGTLDGNGYSIEGLTIGAEKQNNVGLFATVESGGTISNLAVQDASVDGAADVGVVAGDNFGTIRSVAVSGDVGGVGGLGGIVGYNSGTVEASVSTVDVAGSGDGVGGTVGDSFGTQTAVYWNTITSGQSTSGGDATGLTTDEMTGTNATDRMSGLDYATQWAVTDGYPVLRSPTATGDPQLPIDVTDLDESVLVGENALVTVAVTNVGFGNATQTIELSAAGQQRDSAAVTLDVGESTTTQLAWNTTGTVPGSYEATVAGANDSESVSVTVDRPASFEIGGLDAPSAVDAGETIAVNATIENVGTLTGIANVTLAIDGAIVEETTAPLGGGADETVTLHYDVSANASTGSVVANVSTQNDSATRTVSVNGNETLSGTLTDGATGEALSGLNVTIVDDGSTRTVQTDASGAYSVTVLNASAVTVSATTTVGNERSLEITATNATVVDGATTLDLALHPELPGSGTQADPYEISNARELQAMNQDLTGHYVLVDDVNASGTAAWNDGKGFDPIADSLAASFTGTFDGDGHTITGMTIDRPAESNVGLFGFSSGRISNATMRDATVTGDRWVGGLVGELFGSVTNSSVSANVSGTEVVGGIVGYHSGTVDESAVSGTVSGTEDVGGLVGSADSSAAVTDSHAASTVSGREYVGGLVAFLANSGTVEDSYAIGEVSGDSHVGGLIGRAGSHSTVTDAYWDVDTTGQSGSGGDGTGLTTTEMTGVNVTENMAVDFADTWTATDGYPRLRTEVESVDLSVDDATFRPGETADATVTLDLVRGDTATASTVANYTSTAPGVATVAGGRVEAHGAGSATISATVAGLNDSIDVRVAARPANGEGDRFDRPPIPDDVTVALSVDAANLTVGETVTATVTVENEGLFSETFEGSLALDGVSIAEESITVDGGATASYTATHTFAAAGEYVLSAGNESVTLTVGEASDDGDLGDDETGDGTANDGDETAGGDGTDDAGDGNGTSDGGDGTADGGDAGEDAASDGSSGDGSPGFGLLVGALALLLGAGVARRR